MTTRLAEDRAAPAGTELVIRRHFTTPRDRVWDVFTTREHAVHWWGPKDFTVPVLEMNPRVGGSWQAVIRRADGQEYPQHGVYREITPPKRIVFTFVWDREGERSEMQCTFSFAERGNGTDMTFTKGPFPSADAQDGERDGWNECFDRLADYLSRRL